jgi:hypothetical protein
LLRNSVETGKFGLGQWCAQRIEIEFVTGAARAIRQTKLLDPPTPEDIERTGRAALNRIGHE